jgi:membrane protein required for beta-lactamase induction
LVAGWVHYLAFDLFVGNWMLINGRKHNVSHLALIPCLFFTFMLGPVGLLLYFIVRAIKTKKALHENF